MSRPALSYTEDPCPKRKGVVTKSLLRIYSQLTAAGEGRDVFLNDVALRKLLTLL